MVRIGMFLGDRYEILEKVGSGGMAEVFKGKDHKLNRFVAVKVLKDEFVEDKNFVRKFKEEAQAAAGLAHPNIVNVYDVGNEQNINYIVMELVEGITLKTYIEKKGRLTVKEATSIAIQVASGLEVAHNNQIVHRDIKPQNIIISREGKVKVTDFGIAKSASSNTNTADAMGSVHYISPEQARGGYSDAKSDIYSLGIVMYEMLTGRVPFDGETTVAVAIKHLQEDIVSPRVYSSEIPVSLEHIVLKCTEKSPDRRYSNVTELAADLKQSLVTPDVDFVKDVNADGAKTVAITGADIKKIKEETGRINPVDGGDDDDEYDEDEYGDEDEEDEEDEEDWDDEDEDDDDDGGLDPRLEKIMLIGGIVAAVIIVIIVIVIMVKVFGSSGSSDSDTTEIEDVLDDDEESEGVEVPDLLGMSYSEAKEALNEVGLGIKLGDTVTSDTYEAGQIVAQSEEAGSTVEVNTTVVVDVCGDDEDVEIPDVVGYTKSNATIALEALGLSVSVSETYDDDVASGYVISQSPAAGSSVSTGTVVTLVVSLGTETETATVTVPTITGLDESSAKAAITAAGLVSGTVTSEYSDDVEEGYVISQSPSAGSEAESGSYVSYVVSLGEEDTSVYIGNYSGMTEDAAVEKATGKGLNVIVDYEYDDDVAEGYVISTDPVNGSTIEQGDTLTIYVSLGAEPVTTVTIPSGIVGSSYSTAATTLSALGLSVTTGTAVETTDSSLDDIVYSVSPSEGNSVSIGSTVTLVLYTYVESTE